MPDAQGQKNLVRFDFPPGAGPKEIAEAIRKAGYKLLAEKAERDRIAAEDRAASSDPGTNAK